MEERGMEKEGMDLQDIPLGSGVVQALRYPVTNLEGRGSIPLEI